MYAYKETAQGYGKNVKICKNKVISSLFPETLRTPKKGIVK